MPWVLSSHSSCFAVSPAPSRERNSGSVRLPSAFRRNAPTCLGASADITASPVSATVSRNSPSVNAATCAAVSAATWAEVGLIGSSMGVSFKKAVTTVGVGVGIVLV